jgi:hypothetical protein
MMCFQCGTNLIVKYYLNMWLIRNTKLQTVYLYRIQDLQTQVSVTGIELSFNG